MVVVLIKLLGVGHEFDLVHYIEGGRALLDFDVDVES